MWDLDLVLHHSVKSDPDPHGSEKPDPHRSEKSAPADLVPHQSVKLDPDQHESEKPDPHWIRKTVVNSIFLFKPFFFTLLAIFLSQVSKIHTASVLPQL
jgi:hypothetical protein